MHHQHRALKLIIWTSALIRQRYIQVAASLLSAAPSRSAELCTVRRLTNQQNPCLSRHSGQEYRRPRFCSRFKETLVKHRSLLTTLAVLLIATLLPAAIVHVPGDQPTIQAGINAARNGDTVMIDPGTYFENINFNGKAITVISSSGPVSTIIDGGSLAPVVTFASGETPRSVLSRLTLQHGASTFDSQYDGGGIFISNSSPTISKNIIQNNTACNGGAGIAVQFGSPRIQSNTITNNSQFGCTGGIGGGGISVGGAGTTEINRNLISNNHWRSGNGGGISL